MGLSFNRRSGKFSAVRIYRNLPGTEYQISAPDGLSVWTDRLRCRLGGDFSFHFIAPFARIVWCFSGLL
jgi:hypothetical protein